MIPPKNPFLTGQGKDEIAERGNAGESRKKWSHPPTSVASKPTADTLHNPDSKSVSTWDITPREKKATGNPQNKKRKEWPQMKKKKKGKRGAEAASGTSILLPEKTAVLTPKKGKGKKGTLHKKRIWWPGKRPSSDAPPSARKEKTVGETETNPPIARARYPTRKPYRQKKKKKTGGGPPAIGRSSSLSRRRRKN